MPINALSPAPLPSDSAAVFNAKAFALLADLSTFVTEANALAADVNADADTASTQAATATAQALLAAASQAAAAASATAAAQSAGAVQWVSGNSYALGVVVWSPITRYPYRRITAAAVSSTDPSADPTNWAMAVAAGKFITISNAATVTLVDGQQDVTTFAGVCTWRLPLAPTVGMRVAVKAANGRLDNVVDPQGQRIEGQLGTAPLDIPGGCIHLFYVNNAFGWGIE